MKPGYLCVLAMSAGLLGGCGGVFAQPQAPTESNGINLHVCGRPAMDDKGVSRPLMTPEYVSYGNFFLQNALSAKAIFPTSGEDELDAAASCYGRALQLSRESYEATLGMGVIHVSRAQTAIESRHTDDAKASLIAAKQMLGTAYMIRRGAFEPLFYLAWVASLEDETKQAISILDELKAAGYRPGAVALLYGSIQEEEGAKEASQKAYQQVIREGWPEEAVDFAKGKIK